MSTDDPTDDLQKPLGQSPKKKKKPFVLPIPVVTRAIAGMLGFCIAVLVGWILFVDEPFGGEPVAVVSARPNKTAAAASSAKPDAAAPVALG
ncbi:MAG: divergent polysaccharide deacetylase family protein, partial [Microvirga sp.]